jgi:serine/threonine protein phosphatase 1
MKSFFRQFMPSHRKKPRKPRHRLQLENHFSSIYAVGDVHGCLDQLLRLEEKIVADAAERDGDKLIVMLGDYIDRGPSSSAVLDHLTAPPPPGFRRICLAGNHDQMFVDFYDAPSIHSDWLGLGGDETLASYGVYLDDNLHPLRTQIKTLVPVDHIEFLRDLPSMVTLHTFCFAHAGIDPRRSLDAQDDEVLLTSRPHEFEWQSYSGHYTVVHGHTPVKEVRLGSRVNLDLKVYESGQLAALRITEDGMTVLFSD